jgi:hypothetical protein
VAGGTRITEVIAADRPAGLIGVFSPLIMRFAEQAH